MSTIEEQIAEILKESKVAKVEESTTQENTVTDEAQVSQNQVQDEDQDEDQVNEVWGQSEFRSAGANRDGTFGGRHRAGGRLDDEGYGTKSPSIRPKANRFNRAAREADALRQNIEWAKKQRNEDIDVSADVAALVEGENLTEEFKQKAATIFEAAVVNRVKQEIAKLDEEYEAVLESVVEEIEEGLVEKIDGYLGYLDEQWIAQNEIALERGMKSEILENFVGGLKSLFEQHYIDIPEEKFDVVSALETEVEDLQEKLNEQFEQNVKLNKLTADLTRQAIVSEVTEGMVATDKAKLTELTEELAFEDQQTFKKKVQTLRESYFTNKGTVRTSVQTPVTDTPVTLTEETTTIAPQMKNYLSVLDSIKQ